MSLTSDEVKNIAHLARLDIDDASVPEYSENLSRILELMDQMQAVDTDGVKPMAHPIEGGQRLRPDNVTETDQREAFQKLAPQTEVGLYLVPKVIE